MFESFNNRRIVTLSNAFAVVAQAPKSLSGTLLLLLRFTYT
jgi:hypothetical protein